jgi:hypothetical protein
VPLLPRLALRERLARLACDVSRDVCAVVLRRAALSGTLKSARSGRADASLVIACHASEIRRCIHPLRLRCCALHPSFAMSTFTVCIAVHAAAREGDIVKARHARTHGHTHARTHALSVLRWRCCAG